MRLERVFVTPDIAAEWLAHNTNNRTLTRNRVDAMAKDMTSGHWFETHQAIAFNCDGSLKDGQHRLSAVVKSGLPQWFWVATGLPDSAMDYIDTHRARSHADALTLRGYSDARVTIAIATAMLNSVGSRIGDRRSRSEILDFAVRHHDAIRFAARSSHQRGLSSSVALAPVARAWYTQDHDRLIQWFNCLESGVVANKADSAAGACYRLLITPRVASGASSRLDTYCRVESALLAFCEYRPLSKLYATTRELFPIPD